MLSQSSVENNIIVVAGCPLATENKKPTIGAVVCFPNGNIEFYSKQYLHEGEGKYCSSGFEDYIFPVGDYNVALAICADFTNPNHSANAAKKGADIYVTQLSEE